MTTNHPEKLDAALVRPGRVDRKVGFKLAMKNEVEELFVRMYRVSDEDSDENPALVSSNGKLANGSTDRAANGSIEPNSEKHESEITEVEGLDDLAREFAQHVPDDTFTPAEIQNHLMRYKNEPREAVETAQEWKKGLLEEKEEKQRENADEDEDVEE